MINQEYLFGVAKKMSNESYTLPSYLAFGSDSGTLTSSDIVTSGEFDRNSISSITRSDTLVKYIGVRSSAEANNETINVIGLHNAATLASSGNLQANFLVSSLVHTTSFDVDAEFWFDFVGE